jgi:hypothetical protein
MMDTIVYIWVLLAMCTGISQSRSMQNITQAERISELEEKYRILADKVKRLNETQMPGKKVYTLHKYIFLLTFFCTGL